MIRRLPFVLPALALSAFALAVPVQAKDGEVPFWSSIKVKELNMRVGPGEDYRIAWVYHRPKLPLKVLRTMEGWWLVEDPDGAKGWVLAQFLTKRRGMMVVGQGLADMRAKPDGGAKLLWRLEPGVTGLLGGCDDGWCEIDLGEGRTGYVKQDRLWGAADL